MTDRWFDDAAGPVVRPYAMTRGRTRSSSDEVRLDLIALVIAQSRDGEGPAKAQETGDGGGDNHQGAAGEDTGGGAHDNTDVLADNSLAPEHVDIVVQCRRAPQSVAELAAELDLPVGVVRVLIGDLIDADWVRVSRPVPPAELPDESILREVIDGLRAL
ncbi:hypothetical protein DB35_22240 [Streptomyces abyssalis]|uniref:Multi-component regulatory system-11 n=1 Tax=Streptomyces abyssalis TaxID=933944 RepID=A0A1E7JU15_9ACTN|nr:DUF742 domain-containing protein [Streptomyces abyssalis]OEU88913.1 hypothetical protein DB35_22240 [Streptomyces abyssalis]OEU93430.1 hypothetical protein AN215_00915 [Streptomyces abyssalis]